MIRLTGSGGPKFWRSPVFTAPAVTGSSSSSFLLNHNLNDEYVHVEFHLDLAAGQAISNRYDFYEGDTAGDFHGWIRKSFSNPNVTTIDVFNLSAAGRDMVFDVLSYT